MKTIFENGTSYKEFFNEAEDKYKKLMEKILNNRSVSEETILKLKSIDFEADFLVVGEEWCPDCIINIAAIEYMKRINHNIVYKIISKELAGDRFIKYHEEGRLKIPTIFFLDYSYQIKGAFIEKPQTIKDLDLPEKYTQVERILKMKEYRDGQYIESTILEILKMIFDKK